MKAIILAAGYATRLYPLTKDMPKALLEVQNKAIIDYILDEINLISDIDEVFVISNAVFYDKFLEWKDSATRIKPVTILNDNTHNNEERLGAIGDISLLINTFHIDEDVLIIAGDNLFDFKLTDFYDSYKSHLKDCVCVKKYDNKEELKSFAVASISDKNIITDLVEKPQNPKSDIAVFATYIYTKDTVKLFQKYLDEGHNKDAPGYFLEYLYKIKDVFAYEFSGNCIDIGTLSSYEYVKEHFKKL